MGFLDNLKEVGKKTLEGTKKFIGTSVAELKKGNEIISAKKEVLIHLSQEELKKLAYLGNLKNIEYKTNFDGLELKKRKIKLNRLDYVEKIANNVASKDIVYYLKSMHKINLANDLERNVYLIEEKYEQKKKEIAEGKEISKTESDKVLNSYLSIILKSIISLSASKGHEKESFYQRELLGYLKSDLKQKFSKTKIFVEEEHKVMFGKRLDLYVQAGGYRVGIETKYDLTSSGQVQRLLGQIDQYSEFVDALIIVQYLPIKNKEDIRSLNQKRKSSTIPIKIIASGLEVD